MAINANQEATVRGTRWQSIAIDDNQETINGNQWQSGGHREALDDGERARAGCPPVAIQLPSGRSQAAMRQRAHSGGRPPRSIKFK